MNSPALGTPIDIQLVEPHPLQLQRELHQAQLRKRIAAIALIAPLMIFLLITFVTPIAILLKRAVENPEVASALPHTVAILAGWDRKSAPPDAAYADLATAREQNLAGALERRINTEMPGARSMPLADAEGKPVAAADIKRAMIERVRARRPAVCRARCFPASVKTSARPLPRWRRS